MVFLKALRDHSRNARSADVSHHFAGLMHVGSTENSSGCVGKRQPGPILTKSTAPTRTFFDEISGTSGSNNGFPFTKATPRWSF